MFYLHGYLLVSLFLIILSALAQPAIFQYTAAGNPGACASQSNSLIQSVSESTTLAQAALNAIASYETDPQVQKLVDVFFGIKPMEGTTPLVPTAATADALEQVRTNLAAVNSFLTGQPLGDGSGKPWLFCDSSWLSQQAWTDDGFNSNGKRTQKPLSEEYPDKFAMSNILPFWSIDLRNYLFATQAEGPALCTSGTNYGATTTRFTPHTMTLCPVSFQTNGRYKIQALPSAMITPSVVKTSRGLTRILTYGTVLDTQLPVSATLFHELFHLVLGSELLQSWDFSYSQNEILFLGLNAPTGTRSDAPNGQTNIVSARKNPESYLLFAWSCFYGGYDADTPIKPANFPKYDFTTGYAISIA